MESLLNAYFLFDRNVFFLVNKYNAFESYYQVSRVGVYGKHYELIKYGIECEKKRHKTSFIDLDTILKIVCETGNVQTVQYLIDNGAKDWNAGLIGACLGGHMNLVELMTDKIKLANEHNLGNWNKALFFACKGGDIKITKLMIGEGATEFNNGLDGACAGGHIELAKYMITRCATIRPITLYWACRSKSEACVLFVMSLMRINQIITDHHVWIEALEGACYKENENIIRIILNEIKKFDFSDDNKKRINVFNHGMAGACRSRNLKLVKQMIDLGADDWSLGFENACSYEFNNFDVIDLMVQKGTTFTVNDWKIGFYSTCEYAYRNKINYILKIIDSQNCSENQIKDILTEGFLGACHSKKVGAVDMMIQIAEKRQANLNFSSGFQSACKEGSVSVVQYLYPFVLKSHPSQFLPDLLNICLSHAKFYRHSEIFNVIKSFQLIF